MKTITFTPINTIAGTIISPPIPASRCLPEWYKHQNSIIGDKVLLNELGSPNVTVKKCMPVLDDMTAGYYITLASDLVVSYDNNTHSFSWSLDISGHINTANQNEMLPPLIATHSTEQVSHLPIPSEYSVHPFKFNNYYKITTPKGYSCMFRHPSWVFDLPFYTLSGMVDTDAHPVPVNFPFLIRNSWEGIIEAGTPIVQVIPFRRTEWVSEVVGDNNDDGALEYRASTKKILHRYKDNWRSMKLWK